MSRIKFKGRIRHMILSYVALSRISTQVWWQRLTGRALEPEWSALHEIGILFWRHQFTRALNMPDIDEGRAYLDSLQTYTGESHAVTYEPGRADAPPGRWVVPHRIKRDQTLLYFHGGGYTFNPFTSTEFAALLADDLGARLFQLDYRLTPEHPHPAQIDDAMAAYRHVLTQVDPGKLILIGDSAGGHLVLMTLLALREAGLPQPALAVGLCPWTDIGARGQSLHDNDQYDLVSGWMALKFGEFLTEGHVREMRTALSPVGHDFSGLAPIYLQGGGHEILIDMIRDFAVAQQNNGAQVCLDVWPYMAHDFFGHGRSHPDSAQALDRIGVAMDGCNGVSGFKATAQTEIIS